MGVLNVLPGRILLSDEILLLFCYLMGAGVFYFYFLMNFVLSS